MHDLRLLLRLRTDEMFRRSVTKYERNPKRKALQHVHTGIMLLLAALVFLFQFVFSQKMVSMGFAAMLPVYGYVLGALITFLASVLKMNETFAGSEDAEYLLSMPLSSSMQVLTLFLMQYLRNLVLTFLLSAPMGIVYAMSEGVSGAYWVYWVVGQLCTCLPLSGIGSLIGIVLALILSSSSKSNLIQSVVSIGVTGAVIWALLSMLGKIGLVLQNGLARAPSELAAEFVTLFCQNYRFARLFQLGIVEMSPIWTALFLILSVMWYGFFSFLMTMGYPVILISLRCPIDYKKYEFTALKETSVERALFNREVANLLHSRAYFTNSMLGVLLGVLISLFAVLNGGTDLLDRFGVASAAQQLVVSLPLFLCVFVGLSNTTYCSMSLEGKRHWLMESLPMPESVLRRAKQELNLCLTVPLALVSGVLSAAAFHPGVALSVLTVLLPLLYAVLTAWFGSIVGERYAEYDATSEQAAMHQTAPFLLGYLPMVALPLLLGVLVFMIV